MKEKFVSVILFVGILVSLVGCTAPPTPAPPTATAVAPTPTQVVAPPVVSPVPTKGTSLEDLAKAEGGQLMLYTSMNEKDSDAILAGFKEAYPFVNTAYYSDSGELVAAKVQTEAQAGQYLADAFEVDSLSSYRMQQQGLLGSYVPPESASYPANTKDVGGYGTVDRFVAVVIGYNTNLVAPADVPKTWDDLLDPKWKGKMVVEAADMELLGDMTAAWGQEKAYAFWDGIAAQQPAVISGHTELADALAAGTYSITPTVYAHRIEQLKAKGQPVEWVKSDPVFAYTQTLGITAKAPHPATSRLFINWLLSESGQTLYRDLGRIPARPGVSADPPSLTEGLNFFYTSPIVAERYDEFFKKWNELFPLK
jgi:iron(III) transport system substrate-binding protein